MEERKKVEIISDIKSMELVKEGCGFQVYYDDNSGCYFELDIDGATVLAAYEVDEDGEIISVLF